MASACTLQVDVNGPNTAPVYQFLKSQKGGGLMGDDIKWNFGNSSLARMARWSSVRPHHGACRHRGAWDAIQYKFMYEDSSIFSSQNCMVSLEVHVHFCLQMCTLMF